MRKWEQALQSYCSKWCYEIHYSHWSVCNSSKASILLQTQRFGLVTPEPFSLRELDGVWARDYILIVQGQGTWDWWDWPTYSLQYGFLIGFVMYSNSARSRQNTISWCSLVSFPDPLEKQKGGSVASIWDTYKGKEGLVNGLGWKCTLQNILIIAEPSAEPKLTIIREPFLSFRLVFIIFYNEAKPLVKTALLKYYACTHKHQHTHTYTTPTPTHTHIHAHMHIHTHTHTYMHTCAHTHTHTPHPHPPTPTYMHTCTHTRNVGVLYIRIFNGKNFPIYGMYRYASFYLSLWPDFLTHLAMVHVLTP